MHSLDSLDSNSVIPTFILKLWKLVGDETSDNLICWNRSGRSFIIKDQAHFAKDILPLYFKHNNMASFIRQLNMYGFRKVSNIEHGGLKSDADEVEFFHHCFLQDQEDQLQFIKRKITTTKSLTSIVKVDDVHEILSDVESIKGRQESVDSMLNNMKRENEALWREVAILRQKHMKQQQIVEKLLHFLVSIVRNQVVGGIKRKAPLMIDSSSGNNRKILKTNKDGVCMAPSPGASGPIISDITDLDENADLSPLMKDNQLILPTNFDTYGSKFIKSAEENSLLSSNEDDQQFITNNMISLPNSILDFDLSDVQQVGDNISTSELLDDQISSGLSTPKITVDDSSLPLPPPETICQKQTNNTEVGNIADLIVSSQPSPSTSSADMPKLHTEYLTFNNHVDGIDEELNWLQDQLYGGNLNIDPSAIFGIFTPGDQFANIASQDLSTTSSLLPKAIMDGSENSRMIKLEDSPNQTGLFEELDLNNIASETKDILNNADLDLDPADFN